MSVEVLVAVPARNEETTVEACLHSVIAALRTARRHGALDRAGLALAAHCCTDETVPRSRRVLADVGDVETSIWETWTEQSVGALRTTLVRSRWPAGDRADPGCTRWLFSTDADTVVPADWIERGLGLAGEDYAAVLGLIDLDAAGTEPRLRARHDHLVSTGITADGTHRHAYAANLMVRGDAFDRLGGFPDVVHGEEHALVADLRAAGHRVRSTVDLRVITSGRRHGRAAHGLSSVLAGLAAPESAGEDPRSATTDG